MFTVATNSRWSAILLEETQVVWIVGAGHLSIVLPRCKLNGERCLGIEFTGNILLLIYLTSTDVWVEEDGGGNWVIADIPPNL